MVFSAAEQCLQPSINNRLYEIDISLICMLILYLRKSIYIIPMRVLHIIFLLIVTMVFCSSSCEKDKDEPRIKILIATKDTIFLNPLSGVDSVDIVTNDSWTITGMPSWLTVSSGAGSGNATIYFSYPGSPSAISTRTATLFLQGSGKILTITLIQNQFQLTGKATLVAGGGPGFENAYSGWGGYSDATGGTALFIAPSAITTDAQGNLYLLDGFRIRRITPEGVVTTMPGLYPHPTEPTGHNDCWLSPGDVVLDKLGNMYVSDRRENAIYKCTPSGVISLLAGGNSTRGFADGIGALAKFSDPCGMAMDSRGDIILVDKANFRIRRVKLSGEVTTIAGLGYIGFADGPSNLATFHSLESITVDPSDNIYVADWGNSAVRKVTPDGTVKTLVSGRGISDGTLVQSHIEEPDAVASDKKGNIYAYDYYKRIRMITPGGNVYTLSVDHGFGYCFDGIVAGPDNTIYIADWSGFRVYKIAIDQMPE